MAMATITSMAADLCRQFPNAPSRTLARRLYDENRERIASLDSARSAVRCARGAAGARLRKQATVNRERQQAGWRPACPPSRSEPWSPVDLGSGVCVLSISDVHVPYHDRESLQTIVRFAKRRHTPGVLLLNGDFGDFYGISRFERDPKRRDLRDEIELQKQGLAWLSSQFPKARRVFKIGNHEQRWDKFIWNKAPELWNLDAVQLHNILDFDKIGFERVDDQPIMAGKLPILHGHELPRGMSSPVNHARGAFLRTLHSLLVGHGHRTSTHCEPDMFGREVTTWSQGCVCELTPPYMRISKWNWGFAIIDVAKDGQFDVHNYRLSEHREVRTA